MTWIEISRHDTLSNLNVIIPFATLILTFLSLRLFRVSEHSAQAEMGLWAFVTDSILIIPFLGFILGYTALSAERDQNSSSVAMTLPVHRAEIFIAKLTARIFLMNVVIGLAYGMCFILLVSWYNDVEIVRFFGHLIWAMLLGTLFVSIAVAISASVNSAEKALTGVLIFAIFLLVWEIDQLRVQLYRSFIGEAPSTPEGSYLMDIPSWYLLFERLVPTDTLRVLGDRYMGMAVFRENGSEIVTGTSAADRIVGDTPFFAQEWFTVVIVAGWFLVPLAIGYYRFNRADL